jgi:hypothetical protein
MVTRDISFRRADIALVVEEPTKRGASFNPRVRI